MTKRKDKELKWKDKECPPCRLPNGEKNPDYKRWHDSQYYHRIKKIPERHEKILERKREYRKNNPEKIKAYKQEYNHRPEVIKERRKTEKKYRDSKHGKEVFKKKMKKYMKTPKYKALVKRSSKKQRNSPKRKQWEKENKQLIRNSNNKTRYTRKQVNHFKIVDACECKRHKENEYVCSCCGCTNVMSSKKIEARVIETEHKFPVQVFRILYPTYKIAFKELGMNRELYKLLSNNEETGFLKKEAFKNITKEEIRMWFDILCERCNKQIYHHGTCYYGRKNGHSYKVKSSKRIDEFLDLISLNLGEYKEKGLIQDKDVKTKFKPFFERRKKKESRG